VAAAFQSAIRKIRDQAALSAITRLIEDGRYLEVADLLGINSAHFSVLSEAVRGAYIAGAGDAEAEMPRLESDPYRLSGSGYRPSQASTAKIAFSFDLTNPAAEAWLSANAGRLITGIVEDQRAMIVSVIRQGMTLGQGPRQTALDLVGRIGQSGRRSGGLVGLTYQQAGFVEGMRAQLASGDPAQMRGYFDRTLRDQRFDATVRKAMEAGKPVPAATVERITGRYADRLLQYRGENIARTETITAFNAAREEAFRQAIASGSLLPENVTGTWGATGDGRTRHTHMVMNGQERRFGQPFVSPSGAQMMFPGDTSLGAGPEETINCRCTKLYRVDYVAEANRGR
jgi:hypothetical protein